MRVTVLTSILAVLVAVDHGALAQQQQQINILHRVLIPSVDGADPPLFVPRASIDLATHQVTAAPRFHDDLAQFYREARQQQPKSALYQIALQVAPADSLGAGAIAAAAPNRLAISSAKAACASSLSIFRLL